MNRKEYKETLRYELYRFCDKPLSWLGKIRIKYFAPNTNCIYLARKMWYLYSKKSKLAKLRAKLIYTKISHKYGCIIFPSANIGKGFHITHPVGIVIGQCNVGENFMIYQNCTVGTRSTHGSDGPTIGNNVELCSNSVLIGGITVCDNVVIGAQSLVIKNITEAGTYVGSPVVRIK